MALGAWGPLIAIAILHVLMTAVCSVRGEKRPYKLSLKQGTTIATAISICLIIGTFVNFWLGVFFMIAIAVFSIQKGMLSISFSIVSCPQF
ncbi:hypothetical protein LP421_22810 [Rhizobium sp. RCAM05350]|nr:hypothetical protein LP421_22810 [Rhizobium sp. RCAM05350]